MAKSVSRNNICAARADPQTSLWKVENYLWFYVARIVNRSGLIYVFQNARKVCVALTEYYISYCGWRLKNSWLCNGWLCKCGVYGGLVPRTSLLMAFHNHNKKKNWQNPDLDQLLVAGWVKHWTPRFLLHLEDIVELFTFYFYTKFASYLLFLSDFLLLCGLGNWKSWPRMKKIPFHSFKAMTLIICNWSVSMVEQK